MNDHKKLFPSLATNEMEKKPYIITVHRTYGSNKIGYKIIDAQTEKIIKQELDDIDIDDFLKKTSLKNVKVVIFNISDFDRETSDIDYDVKTREKISTILRTMKVPHLFVNDKTYAAMTALMYAKVVPKVGERILAITVVMEDLAVIELIREHRGYKIVERRDIKCSVDDTNFKKLQTDILGKNVPSKIIIMSLLPLLVNG
uniref:Uncharacterized protein n=1 Tax=Panagrolaimus sp. ES5 TaxID=591445 RepID=A0AC34GGK5_9BILA